MKYLQRVQKHIVETTKHPIFIWSVYFILTSSIIACDQVPIGIPTPPPENQGQETETHPDTPNPELDVKQFCFPNNGAGVVCMGIYNRPLNYEYLEPTANNNFPQTQNPIHYARPIYLFSKADYPATQYITKNFKWGEFFTNNIETYGLILPVLLEKIQDIREEIDAPIIVNSSYRSPKYNNTIDGSAKWSRHIYGDAVDFRSTVSSLKDLKASCKKFGADYIQVYASHVHCDWREAKKDPLLFPVMTNDLNWKYKPEPLPKISISNTATTITATVSEPSKEDGEPLLYEWTIIDTKHRNNLLKLLGRRVTWPRNSSRYKIRLIIGGNITVNKTVKIKDPDD